jgi:hypothetical protein
MSQLPLFEPLHLKPQKQSQKHSISSITTKRIAFLQLKVELLPPEPAKPTTPVRLCRCGKPTEFPVLNVYDIAAAFDSERRKREWQSRINRSLNPHLDAFVWGPNTKKLGVDAISVGGVR